MSLNQVNALRRWKIPSRCEPSVPSMSHYYTYEADTGLEPRIWPRVKTDVIAQLTDTGIQRERGLANKYTTILIAVSKDEGGDMKAVGQWGRDFIWNAWRKGVWKTSKQRDRQAYS